MNNKFDCRAAPDTPGLLNIANKHNKNAYMSNPH